MKNKRFILSMTFFAFVTLITSSVFAQDKYMEIIANQVNIHVAPNTSSAIISKSQKGDIFELHGEEEEWYKINIFSGEWRYVYKSLAKPTAYTISLPKEASTRRDIFRAFRKAEDRAEAEADRKYPLTDKRNYFIPDNMKKNIDHKRLLNDRYKLEIIRKFGIQAPAYNKILIEGTKKEWF